jgi:hypothetical protein
MNRTASLPKAANNGPKIATSGPLAPEAKGNNAIYPPVLD